LINNSFIVALPVTSRRTARLAQLIGRGDSAALGVSAFPLPLNVGKSEFIFESVE